MAFPLVPLVTAVAPSVIGAITNVATSSPQSLGKEDFLKLLVAQLKNQNPFNPLANDQFIAQTTAFSSLEELQNIRKSLEVFGSAGDAQALSGAAALLGRPVTATAGGFYYAGLPVALPYTLTAPVGSAVLEVTDLSGALVARQSLGPQIAGPHSAEFIPPTNRVLPEGELRYRILSMDGGRSTLLPAIAGSVTGITVAGGQPLLQVGPVTVRLSDVITVGTPTS